LNPNQLNNSQDDDSDDGRVIRNNNAWNNNNINNNVWNGTNLPFPAINWMNSQGNMFGGLATPALSYSQIRFGNNNNS